MRAQADKRTRGPGRKEGHQGVKWCVAFDLHNRPSLCGLSPTNTLVICVRPYVMVGGRECYHHKGTVIVYPLQVVLISSTG